MSIHAVPQRNSVPIVTLTMNPCLDITTSVNQVRPTDKLRCQDARHDPGGGGINVARIAHVLGSPVTAVFPAGGPIGEVVTDLLARENVPFRRVKIAGRTRESFTVNEQDSGQQYRFVLPGPQLTSAERALCVDELRAAATSARYVVASGSLPPGVPTDFYQHIARVCG
ncbi:1-phosphofructokinase family hexose kinase, partial [Mycobacterium sp.]|uniref:1-phosphofructokinase family hexose kinase n=1 Tax=Mycobacterium sp. TaxID=1785 RepID=UPI003BAF6001